MSFSSSAYIDFSSAGRHFVEAVLRGMWMLRVVTTMFIIFIIEMILVVSRRTSERRMVGSTTCRGAIGTMGDGSRVSSTAGDRFLLEVGT